MDKLIRKYHKERPLFILNYLKKPSRFYLKLSIHARINVKSRLAAFRLYHIVKNYRQPY